MRTNQIVFFVVFILSILLLSGGEPVEASTPIEVGYRDFQFPSGLGDGSVTSEKPENKLWYNDGHWWASMWSTSGNSYHIFKLDWTTQDWTDTGTALDDRQDSKADALWDGSKLYVVSHIWSKTSSSASSGEEGELYRYSYSGGTYTLDSGYPVIVSDAKTEALVIDKDSTGLLWVTYVNDKKVYVNHSTAGDDANWVGPYVLPVSGADSVDSDDLSSVVAFDGNIGIMWSDQSSGNKMYFAAHADGTDDQIWQSIGAYTTSGDDHINLKSLTSDGAGKVFAAIKTSVSNALLMLLVCDGGSCTSASDWSAYTVYKGSDADFKEPTRPTLLLDTSNRDIYFFTRLDDDIYYKRADMDSISFSSGKGEAFIKSSDYSGINDPTTTKQNVNNSSGLVVLANDDGARYYFHNCIQLAGGNSSQCLSANPSPEVHFSSDNYDISEDGSPTAEVTVELTGSVAGDVTVDYTITDGSATDGLDYTASSDTLTFPSGSTTPQTIYIPIIDDFEQETPETVNISLSGLTGTGVVLGTPNAAVLTINDDDVPPTINFGSPTYSVVENELKATIDVMLSNSFDTPVTVQYATSGGTAVAGSDYEAISPTTLTFNPGDPLSKTFDVTLIDDLLAESDKTVQLSLSNPSANASLGTQSNSTLTIIDNETPLEVAFDSPTYSVIENAGPAMINIVLSRPYATVVSVSYQTSLGGSATPGNDYVTISATPIEFLPGETIKSFEVTINDDDVEELEETVLLNLSSPSTGVMLGAQNSATLSIFDNDVAPEINLSSSTYNVNENSVSALITVNLSHSFDTPVSIDYQTANGSATAGIDYTAIPATTLTFETGEMSKNFPVFINNDGIPEPTETVQIILSNPSLNAILGAQNSAELSILDDDTIPKISLDSAAYEIDEDSGTGTLSATVMLDTASAQTVRVDYKTNDETAEAGNDYLSADATLVFPAGETSQEIIITILDDTLEEGDETFNLSLSNPQNGEIGTPNNATVTIVDDDLPPTISFTEASYSVDEDQGQVMFTAELNHPVNYEFVADYATSDGTATADDDYEATSGQLVFPPFQTSKSFTVKINDDSRNEQDETAYVSLTTNSSAQPRVAANTTLTIVDNDRPKVQFKTFNYVKYGPGVAVVEVKLSAPAEATVAVSYATSDGTAIAGSDYIPASGTLIFQPGITQQTFAISVLNGAFAETGKTINLSLSSPQLADMGVQDTAVLTIMETRYIFLPLLKKSE